MLAGELPEETLGKMSSIERLNFDHATVNRKIHTTEWRNPAQLKPHPRNDDIYGDEDVTDLVERIRQSNWIKELVIAPIGRIISGHRRWKAALKLGLERIPVVVVEFPNEIAELEALLLENASRFKSTEQKVREADAWREVERVKAKNRQGTRTDIQENFPRCNIHGEGVHPNFQENFPGSSIQNEEDRTDIQENFPECATDCDSGQVRDLVARRVGLGSGRTYEKASKVLNMIDTELESGNTQTAEALRKTLNEQSVDAAHTLLKKSDEELQAIAKLIVTGEAKSTKQAESIIRRNNSALNSKQVTDDRTERLFQVNDVVLIDLECKKAASAREKRCNRFWGLIRQVGEEGSFVVDVGFSQLQLFPSDIKPLSAVNGDFFQIVERVLRLRTLELDEIEVRMLDVIQQKEQFTFRQLVYLENIERLCSNADV